MSEMPTAEQMLQDAAWLKRLATTLANDKDDADDLVQESWIAVWRRQPDASRPMRPWLAKVVRDLAGMKRRSDRRRVAREASADDGQAPAAPDELVEQMRLHRLLVDLVLELDEPYRSTVIARFVEGRTSVSIASSLGIPAGTVRKRLREALSRLRAGLDAKSGDRKRWAPAVLTFAKKGVQVAKPTTTLAVLAGLLLLIGSIVLIWALRGSKSGRDHDEEERGAVHAHRAQGSGHREDADDLIFRLAANRPPGWLSQDGVKARRIAGHVLVDGVPANGAVVRLTSELSLAGLVGARELQTAPDGHFDFGYQVATLYAIGAVVPGRVATVVRVDLRDPQSHPEDIVLGLDPCVVGFFGKVIDASGSPIPHAELLAQDVIGTETDRSGSFDLCLPPQGRPEDLRLVIRAGGYGAVELVATLSGRVHHDFVLSPEGVVSGRAVTTKGQPVPNAEIRLDWDEAAPRPGSEQPAPVRVASDSDGRFHVAGVAAGRRRVVAFGRELAATPFTVDVGAGESKDIVVTMTARTIVRGRVVLDRKPVAGVIISDRAETPTYQARGTSNVPATEAVSQADGTFVLDAIAPGDVNFTTTPYRLRTPKTVHVTPGEQNVTFEVEALGEIVGTVRRHGKPVPHTRVTATAPQGWVQTSTTETDESGRFVLRGLDAGDYVIFADNATVGAFVPEGAKVSLALGERHEVEIDLTYGAHITGSVQDAKSAPVSGALVRFTAETDDLGRCVTDSAGHFDCGSMTGGTRYRVDVLAGEASPVPFSFVGPPPPPILLADGDAQVDGVRLVVEVQKLAISGVVVDSADAPIADARVLAIAGFNEWTPVPTTITTTTGHFEIGDLSGGNYALQVMGPDSSKTRTEPIPAGTKGVRIVLDPPSCSSDVDPKVGSVLHAEPTTIASRPHARVVWDDRIELIGWDIPQHVRLGDEFTITLFYRVLRPIGRSWKTFIHVDGPTMRVNADHDPLGGRCPTSTWQQGDVLVDHFTIRIDPSNGAGNYDVWTGFFTGWAPTWKNMTVTQAPPDMRDSHERIKVTAIAAD